MPPHLKPLQVLSECELARLRLAVVLEKVQMRISLEILKVATGESELWLAVLTRPLEQRSRGFGREECTSKIGEGWWKASLPILRTYIELFEKSSHHSPLFMHLVLEAQILWSKVYRVATWRRMGHRMKEVAVAKCARYLQGESEEVAHEVAHAIVPFFSAASFVKFLVGDRPKPSKSAALLHSQFFVIEQIQNDKPVFTWPRKAMQFHKVIHTRCSGAEFAQMMMRTSRRWQRWP